MWPSLTLCREFLHRTSVIKRHQTFSYNPPQRHYPFHKSNWLTLIYYCSERSEDTRSRWLGKNPEIQECCTDESVTLACMYLFSGLEAGWRMQNSLITSRFNFWCSKLLTKDKWQIWRACGKWSVLLKPENNVLPADETDEAKSARLSAWNKHMILGSTSLTLQKGEFRLQRKLNEGWRDVVMPVANLRFWWEKRSRNTTGSATTL